MLPSTHNCLKKPLHATFKSQPSRLLLPATAYIAAESWHSGAVLIQISARRSAVLTPLLLCGCSGEAGGDAGGAGRGGDQDPRPGAAQGRPAAGAGGPRPAPLQGAMEFVRFAASLGELENFDQHLFKVLIKTGAGSRFTKNGCLSNGCGRDHHLIMVHAVASEIFTVCTSSVTRCQASAAKACHCVQCWRSTDALLMLEAICASSIFKPVANRSPAQPVHGQAWCMPSYAHRTCAGNTCSQKWL